jgi:Bacterial PH domain
MLFGRKPINERMASATTEDLRVSKDQPLRVNQWSESVAWAYAGCLGLLGIYAAAFLQPQGPHVWAYRGLGLLLMIVALSIVRSAMGGIWVQPDGVRIRTTFRSYELTWSEIRSFRLRRKSPCLAVELNDGRTIGVFGLQASRSGEQDRAGQLVAMLNRSLMAGHAAGDAGGGTRTSDTRIMMGDTHGPERSNEVSQARKGALSSGESPELGARLGARRKRKQRRSKS